jgi:hypothetical protein
MIESLAWLSEEGADDCFFGGAISSREFCQLFDVSAHGVKHEMLSWVGDGKDPSHSLGMTGFARHLGGTGTTVPQFLQVRSFSSVENFW